MSTRIQGFLIRAVDWLDEKIDEDDAMLPPVLLVATSGGVALGIVLGLGANAAYEPLWDGRTMMVPLFIGAMLGMMGGMGIGTVAKMMYLPGWTIGIGAFLVFNVANFLSFVATAIVFTLDYSTFLAIAVVVAGVFMIRKLRRSKTTPFTRRVYED